MPVAQDALWYKDAIIYQLHVKSFFDSDNDGIGDFPGLISKLDYIAELGVNTLWLLPFYPSPRLDDGYDIAEYTAVHPEYGTLDDVKRFIDEAHRRGIRVITELVINHTSDQHAWFQRARQAPAGSPERDFYVWSDNDQKYAGTRIIFVDTQRSNWTWDPVANAYYWHRFYAHQPDLNFDNPEVLKAVLRIMHFWLDMGVDGLRLDAVPYLMEREGTNNENLPETHDVLKRIRADLDASYPGRMLLAEANQWPEDTKEYFGQGDECHMAFHFPLMPRMYMALAREDRFPITDIMRQTPQIPDNCQWAIFLRNHDELTLEMVTDLERDYLWQTYATDRRARLNLGIRRRLAPLLERDRRRIELMNSLLFSMPGAPVIYYGDELGMGDNIRLGDRDGVRTPMQWSPDRNGGFSRADPAALALPVIMDALYGYETINAEAQTRDAHSLLHWMRRMLAIRRQHAAFGRGALRFLYPKNRKVLAYLRELDGEAILCVANVSHTPQAVELDLSEFNGRVPVELTGGSLFPPIGKLTYLLTLPPFGFYWFILTSESESPSWHTPAPEPMPDYVTVVLRNRLDEALESAAPILERETLPPYLQKRRWFGAKDQALQSSHIAYTAQLGGERDMLLAEVEVKTDGATSRWQLPLSMCWEDEPSAALPSQLALARVRRGRRIGLLTDAFSLPAFARQMLACARRRRAHRRRRKARSSSSRRPTRSRSCAGRPMRHVMWLTAEQSNSSLIVDDAVMLKIFRRISTGEHPEAEMSRYLTAHNFANAPALLGEVSRIDRRRATPCAGRRAGLRAQPGRCLDLGPEPGQPRLRRHGEPRGLRRIAWRRHQGLSRPGRGDRPPARRHAHRAGAAHRRSGLRAARGRPRGRRGLDRAGDGDAGAERSTPSPRARTGTTKRSKPMPRALLASREALERGAAPTGRERRRHAHDAHPRRLPSGPGAGRQRRRLHHRLRGRAGAAAGRTPRQGQPLARRRGPVALHRLCGGDGARPQERDRKPRVAGTAPEADNAPARGRGKGVPRRLSRGHRQGRQEATAGCSTSS